jgi:hypothetical protein
MKDGSMKYRKAGYTSKKDETIGWNTRWYTKWLKDLKKLLKD